jgi:hypothetical protein
MMIKQRVVVALKNTSLAILCVALSLCACVPEETIVHPRDIPTDDLNKSIQLIAPDVWNTYKLNDRISMQVINTSIVNIEFDKDLGKRLFWIQGGQLAETEDKMIQIDAIKEIIVLTPGSLEGQRVPIKPKEVADGKIVLFPGERTGLVVRVESGITKSLVRVYVIGKVSGTNDFIAAFIDIVLTP